MARQRRKKEERAIQKETKGSEHVEAGKNRKVPDRKGESHRVLSGKKGGLLGLEDGDEGEESKKSTRPRRKKKGGLGRGMKGAQGEREKKP